ncbi:PTPM1-like protein [Mya arenaria]|uniref:PTPM1-like protein n=1 Tax=Mya arenaria TaxID=6604 RepID=A0ABY7E843_MYAAR|nr:PTPM1-like protein [Mya arenaria]
MTSSHTLQMLSISENDRRIIQGTAMSLFNKVAFYPTLFYNVFLSKVSSRRWYDRIDDTVLLGALPFRGMTKWLVKEENVKGVEWAAVGVTQLKVPTVDFTASPSHEKICRAVDFMIKYRNERLGSVYVHCKAGRTRSATVVACYLVKTEWEEGVADRERISPYTGGSGRQAHVGRKGLRKKESLINVKEYLASVNEELLHTSNSVSNAATDVPNRVPDVCSDVSDTASEVSKAVANEIGGVDDAVSSVKDGTTEGAELVLETVECRL